MYSRGTSRDNYWYESNSSGKKCDGVIEDRNITDFLGELVTRSSRAKSRSSDLHKKERQIE
jgi:hypothetical protein